MARLWQEGFELHTGVEITTMPIMAFDDWGIHTHPPTIETKTSTTLIYPERWPSDEARYRELAVWLQRCGTAET